MTMPKPGDWSRFRNILCIRLDNLGDVLMTTPAIRALKNTDRRKITLLTSQTGGTIAKYIPEIDHVIEFNPPWEKNARAGSGSSVYELVGKLRERSFDAAVIFTVYSQNPLPAAMICYLSEIPRVAGYCRENPDKLITDWIPDKEPLYEIKHEVVRQLNLVKALGAESEEDHFSLAVPEEAVRAIPEKLKSFGIAPEEPWLVMHPGASEPRRRYPAGLFAEAARRITEELEYQVILTGIPAEKDLAEHIVREAGKKVYSLVGQLRLEELMALILKAPLLIANNTGPVHVAAAVKTPVIVLYALTNPQHAPWNIRHNVLPFDVPREKRSKNTIITYAYERSVTRHPDMIRPEQVVQAVRNILRDYKIPEITELVTL